MEKELPYSSRVLVGQWFHVRKIEEDKESNFLKQMQNGNLLLAKYRRMLENLSNVTTLTQSPSSISFGSKISLKAPHVDAHQQGDKGMLLSGFISELQIDKMQTLSDGCGLAGISDCTPRGRNTFVLSSADKCNREGEPLKYNQEFLLVLESSMNTKPLYVRYDSNPVPGINTKFPLYLSENPVSNTRWRVLPIQTPERTRFEQEGLAISVNEDIIINHCSTNTNLCVNNDVWMRGFWEMLCSVIVRTDLNKFKMEKPSNIWQIHSAMPEHI